MSRTIEILSPVAPVRAGDHPLAPRPPGLGGRRIGLFHNNKPNADVLLERAGELIAARCEGVTLVRWGKENPALPEPRLGEFLPQVDLAVCAVGD